MRIRVTVQRRLAQVRDEVRRLRETLRVLEEQLSYQEEVAEEATTRAIVASTPLADRERREAEEGVRRLRAQRDEVAQQIQELLIEQDALLDRAAIAGLASTDEG